MPTQGGAALQTPRPTPQGLASFPPVLKHENPSAHIMKYMDGVSKRSIKAAESYLRLA